MVRYTKTAIAALLYNNAATQASFIASTSHRINKNIGGASRIHHDRHLSSSSSRLQMSFIDEITSTTSLPNNLDQIFNNDNTNPLSNLLSLFTISTTDSDLSSLLSQIPTDQLNQLISTTINTVTKTLSTLDDSILNSLSTSHPILLSSIYTPIRNTFLSLTSSLPPDLYARIENLPPASLLVTSTVVTYVITSGLLNALGDSSEPAPSRPYPNNVYDEVTARRYFDQRWGMVVGRGVEVAVVSLGFGLNLARDYLSDKLETNASQRALELSSLLTTLGPSFIKIGQSLSIRTDILSPAYVRGLKTLQDNVPPFPTDMAKATIAEELGISSIEDIFESLSAEPVAAASLGQVYRGTLTADGREVAVKVQRPDIANIIALDMHLIREVAPVLKRTFHLNTDLVGVVDTWGKGFVDELDYVSEGRNAVQFTASLKGTPLESVVFAPPVVEELTTGRVLVTEWVEGERLDVSDKEDVTVLCSIAMNTYLTMMLETGVLHCDPHPGNLLRTPDGRLCILDWGMVTKLTPNLQITLIEHMAHLTSADYAEIPQDLLLLGFIPESQSHLIKDSGVVETLADVYGAWTAGGGVAKIDVNQVIGQLQDLTASKGNLFQIPPYFAYIAKSFSVLEGIGLSNDENYSIVNECLPYVSKRLLTDKSERTGGALNTFIFGPAKNDKRRIIDYDRVEQLITGFGDYSTATSGALLGKESVARVTLLERTADDILDLLVTEDETPLQKIVLEQFAKIVSSVSKSLWGELRERSGLLPSGRTVLGTLVDPLGLFRTSPIVRMDELDEKTITTTRHLLELLQRRSAETTHQKQLFDMSSLSNEEIVDLSSMVVRKVWQRRNGVFETGRRLGKMLIELTADKLESGERSVYTLETTRGERSLEDEGGLREEKGVTAVSQPTVAATTATAIPAEHNAGERRKRLESAKRLLAQLEKEKEESERTTETTTTTTTEAVVAE